MRSPWITRGWIVLLTKEVLGDGANLLATKTRNRSKFAYVEGNAVAYAFDCVDIPLWKLDANECREFTRLISHHHCVTMMVACTTSTIRFLSCLFSFLFTYDLCDIVRCCIQHRVIRIPKNTFAYIRALKTSHVISCDKIWMSSRIKCTKMPTKLIVLYIQPVNRKLTGREKGKA